MPNRLNPKVKRCREQKQSLYTSGSVIVFAGVFWGIVCGAQPAVCSMYSGSVEGLSVRDTSGSIVKCWAGRAVVEVLDGARVVASALTDTQGYFWVVLAREGIYDLRIWTVCPWGDTLSMVIPEAPCQITVNLQGERFLATKDPHWRCPSEDLETLKKNRSCWQDSRVRTINSQVLEELIFVLPAEGYEEYVASPSWDPEIAMEYDENTCDWFQWEAYENFAQLWSAVWGLSANSHVAVYPEDMEDIKGAFQPIGYLTRHVLMMDAILRRFSPISLPADTMDFQREDKILLPFTDALTSLHTYQEVLALSVPTIEYLHSGSFPEMMAQVLSGIMLECLEERFWSTFLALQLDRQDRQGFPVHQRISEWIPICFTEAMAWASTWAIQATLDKLIDSAEAQSHASLPIIVHMRRSDPLVAPLPLLLSSMSEDLGYALSLSSSMAWFSDVMDWLWSDGAFQEMDWSAEPFQLFRALVREAMLYGEGAEIVAALLREQLGKLGIHIATTDQPEWLRQWSGVTNRIARFTQAFLAQSDFHAFSGSSPAHEDWVFWHIFSTLQARMTASSSESAPEDLMLSPSFTFPTSPSVSPVESSRQPVTHEQNTAMLTGVIDRLQQEIDSYMQIASLLYASLQRGNTDVLYELLPLLHEANLHVAEALHRALAPIQLMVGSEIDWQDYERVLTVAWAFPAYALACAWYLLNSGTLAQHFSTIRHAYQAVRTAAAALKEMFQASYSQYFTRQRPPSLLVYHVRKPQRMSCGRAYPLAVTIYNPSPIPVHSATVRLHVGSGFRFIDSVFVLSDLPSGDTTTIWTQVMTPPSDTFAVYTIQIAPHGGTHNWYTGILRTSGYAFGKRRANSSFETLMASYVALTIRVYEDGQVAVYTPGLMAGSELWIRDLWGSVVLKHALDKRGWQWIGQLPHTSLYLLEVHSPTGYHYVAKLPYME